MTRSVEAPVSVLGAAGRSAMSQFATITATAIADVIKFINFTDLLPGPGAQGQNLLLRHA